MVTTIVLYYKLFTANLVGSLLEFMVNGRIRVQLTMKLTIFF